MAPEIRYASQRRSPGFSACLPKNLEHLGTQAKESTPSEVGSGHRSFKISPGDSEGLIG